MTTPRQYLGFPLGRNECAAALVAGLARFCDFVVSVDRGIQTLIRSTRISKSEKSDGEACSNACPDESRNPRRVYSEHDRSKNINLQ